MQRLLISVSKHSWYTSSVPQGSILDTALFSIINYLDDGAEGSLSNFTDVTKMGGEDDKPEGHAVIQGISTGWRTVLART